MCDRVYEVKNFVDPKITKFNYEEINGNKMLRALSSIALEMQRFHASTPMSYCSFGDKEELHDKLSIYKSKMRLKRKQIKLLKQNLRKACFVAKTLVSAKEKETMSLHNHINSSRSDCVDLYHKNLPKTDTITNLISENQALQEKITNLEEFIELGYQQLQKMRNRCAKNLPTVMKLKEIMITCGQYYADYANEYDTRLHLEQRNRFLDSKIKILVTNADGIAEELRNVRYQNDKLRKENASLKNGLMKRIENGMINSKYDYEYAYVHDNGTHNKHTETFMAGDHNRTFNLNAHLSLVQKLLHSQDFMLKDLKKLSENLKIEPKEVNKDLS